MAVTLAEKIWEKERAKVEKCPSAPNRCEKKLFPSRVGNQGDFDSHGQKYFPGKNTTKTPIFKVQEGLKIIKTS